MKNDAFNSCVEPDFGPLTVHFDLTLTFNNVPVGYDDAVAKHYVKLALCDYVRSLSEVPYEQKDSVKN